MSKKIDLNKINIFPPTLRLIPNFFFCRKILFQFGIQRKRFQNQQIENILKELIRVELNVFKLGVIGEFVTKFKAH